MAAQFKGSQAVAFGIDRQMALRIRRDDVIYHPLGVMKIHTTDPMGSPPMQKIQRPEGSGKAIARTGALPL